MNDDRRPWRDGRQAWDRLDGWHLDGQPEPTSHPDDADAALRALDDVGLVRHLLDQAELVAVRTARRHGRSWAEIAIKLGVTRQSAWERWRDLDEPAGPQPPADTTPPLGSLAHAAAALTRQAAGNQRRRSSIVVPNVIGQSWDEARQLLHERQLVAVGSDPDEPPRGARWLERVVTDQSPEAGARVPAGSPVTLWTGSDGGSGVREPRRPTPTPRTDHALPSDEAVG